MTKEEQKTHRSLSRSLQTVMTILDFDLQKEISERLDKSREITIVDIGAGVGRSLWELSELFSREGVDLDLIGIYYSSLPDPKSPFYANERRYEDVRQNPRLVAEEFSISPENKAVPRLMNADACKRLPIEDHLADIMYSTNAFHFFVDKIAAIEEMSRVLRVGGKAIINIDRTDEDFWPSDFHFPRLRLTKAGEAVDAKEFLESKTGGLFTLTVRNVDSYGSGPNSYVLTIEKHGKGSLAFPELQMDKEYSFSLDKIRFCEGDYKNTAEYKALLHGGMLPKKGGGKEDFGGYLSSYALQA